MNLSLPLPWAGYSPSGISSRRLLVGVDVLNLLHLKDVHVYGKERLAIVPPNRPLIIATTHLGELDMPAAIGVLGRYFDLIIANASLHHSLRLAPGVNIAMHVVGKHHFYPIDYEGHGETAHGIFNPQNYLPLRRAMLNGKTLIIAAHNPVIHEQKLPCGGYGAVYACSITEGAIILPVTVHVEAHKPVNAYRLPMIWDRPKASLFIHPPMELHRIPSLDLFTYLATKRHHREPFTDDEQRAFCSIRDVVQIESDRIMRVLARPLPPEKKGAYR